MRLGLIRNEKKVSENSRQGVGCLVDLFRRLTQSASGSGFNLTEAKTSLGAEYLIGIGYYFEADYFFGVEYIFGAESRVSEYFQYCQKDSRVTSPGFLEAIQL